MVDIGFEEQLEEEGEGERDQHNMMNNSLLQVYRHDDSAVSSPTPAPSSNTTTNSAGAGTPTSSSHSCCHGIGPDHLPLGLYTGEAPIINWDDDDDVSGAENGSEVKRSEVVRSPVVLGPDGVPIAEIDTSAADPGHVMSHVISNVTSGDGHVTSGGGPSAGGEVEMKGTVGTGGVVVCASGEGVSVGRVEGAESEEKRKLKKVTFAPDVMDNKQTSSILKVNVF